MAILIAAMFLLMSGVWAGAVLAGPDKEPDTTLNDHPSGKDRNEEPGGSGTQGKSTSDPDGQANGGADKPGGDGGFDADQDGNNGCGNDDDFEDDNNGNCGGVRAQGTTTARLSSVTTTTLPTTTTTLPTTTTTSKAAVQGVSLEQSVDDTKVLGVSFVRSEAAAPAALAATGAPAVELIAIACALIALGACLLVGARRRTPSLA